MYFVNVILDPSDGLFLFLDDFWFKPYFGIFTAIEIKVPSYFVLGMKLSDIHCNLSDISMPKQLIWLQTLALKKLQHKSSKNHIQLWIRSLLVCHGFLVRPRCLSTTLQFTGLFLLLLQRILFKVKTRRICEIFCPPPPPAATNSEKKLF